MNIINLLHTEILNLPDRTSIMEDRKVAITGKETDVFHKIIGSKDEVVEIELINGELKRFNIYGIDLLWHEDNEYTFQYIGEEILITESSYNKLIKLGL